MPRYSFTSLSSQDFEELVRDLLQAEWNVRLEAFKSGRDSGIDLRYSTGPGTNIIIQCKHYANSGYSKLLSDLRDKELPKVQTLKPARYVVATSVGLSPANKNEMAQTLTPFVLTPNDILGANDIEGLLSRHSNVERANFKLWLTSIGVLERVLHNAELCQTDFSIDRIRRKLPLFVQNEAFPRASALLKRSRVAVISGPPGIGKTTLAEMLLYEHLERGFEPVVIQAEVVEGKRLFRPKEKQIFYYDDFLGQTFLGDRAEYLGRNEDAAIVDFMEMVARSPDSRFILTTREHILRSAFQLSERLAHSPDLDHRCILELSDYSYGQKARILYNHLYFSNLPSPYKEALLEDCFFLSIIKHEHFNPRLIEWLSSQTRLKDVTAENYRVHVTALLDSPDSIWSHAFRNQISQAARNALFALYSLGDWSEVRDLELAFISLHRRCATKYHQPIAAGDFRKALLELDGGFLSFSRGHASFLNPSIREFVASVIAADPEIADDILTSAVRFKQTANLWRLAEARKESEIVKWLDANLDVATQAWARLLHTPETRWEKRADGRTIGTHFDAGPESKIQFLAGVAATRNSEAAAVFAQDIAVALVKTWGPHVPEFLAAIRLMENLSTNKFFLAHDGRRIYDSMKDGVLEHIAFARAFEWVELLTLPGKVLGWTQADDQRLDAAFSHYRTSGVYDERYECSTADELSELKEALEQLEKKYGLDFRSDRSSIDDAIADHEERRKLDDGDGGHRYSENPAKFESDRTTDDDVIQMFDTLR